jgi:hypothetical protein
LILLERCPIIDVYIETHRTGDVIIKMKYNILFRQLFVNDYPNLNLNSFLSVNVRKINKLVKDTIEKAKVG